MLQIGQSLRYVQYLGLVQFRVCFHKLDDIALKIDLLNLFDKLSNERFCLLFFGK